MKAYVDTSALLRLVFGEPRALDELRAYDAWISSELLVVECARTIDRLRLNGSLNADEASRRITAIDKWIDAVDLVLVRPPVLARAAEPLPVPLGTLDALHLATALTWRDRMNEPLVVARHDAVLASAARAFRFDVVGA